MISLNTPSDALQAIASCVKKTRLRADVTMNDLAKRSGIGIATLSRIEKTGVCSTETLARVFGALGLLDSFVGSLEPPEITSISSLRKLSQKQPRQRARRKT
jgi:transcriptional regulator with XRE-family HTH domain